MGRGGGSSGRAGVSTPSGRGAQSPTEQAWTVTQHQGPARSGRAGAVTRFRWAQPGAVTPRLSPTILRSVDGHAIPQRGHNRGHHPSAESAPCTTRTHRGQGQRRGPWTPIGIGGRLAAPPLPHHRAYGSVPRRFGRVSSQGRSRCGNPSEAKYAPGSAQQSAAVSVTRQGVGESSAPDTKYAPGSAQQSAAVSVTRHGPRLLRAVRMASFAFTPRFRSSRKRVRARCHCFQTTARSRRRIHASRRRRSSAG